MLFKNIIALAVARKHICCVYLGVDDNAINPRLMNGIYSTKVISKLRSLGAYQVVGGSIGCLPAIWAILNNQAIDLSLFVYCLMVLFFAFSIYCGILCFRRKIIAVKFSLINQILQVIGVAIFGFAFKYAAGVYVTAGLDLSESFNFTFGAGFSRFDFAVNADHHRLEVDLNFIALPLIIFIERLKNHIKEEQDKLVVSGIGER